MHAADEAAEHHVDGGGVQDGGEEDESALDGVGGDLVGVVVREDAGRVADYLDCGSGEEWRLARNQHICFEVKSNSVGRIGWVRGTAAEKYRGTHNVHDPPTAKGMQNQDRVFTIRQQWALVTPVNSRMNMLAAGTEGRYFQM